MRRAGAGHRRAKDLVKRIHLAARLAHLPREVEQLLLLPHLTLRRGVALEPVQRDSRLLRERERRALVTRTKAPSQTQAGMQLIIQEHGNAQPSDIGGRGGQRRLKRRRAPHQHRLACLSDTRDQMLSSRAQFDLIWQRVRAKLRQYDDGRPIWKQDGRASARKEITDGCEEMRIYLTKVRLRIGLRGR